MCALIALWRVWIYLALCNINIMALFNDKTAGVCYVWLQYVKPIIFLNILIPFVFRMRLLSFYLLVMPYKVLLSLYQVFNDFVMLCKVKEWLCLCNTLHEMLNAIAILSYNARVFYRKKETNLQTYSCNTRRLRFF